MTARRERRRRPWSLQRQLVFSIVALFAAVGLVVGTISVLALRQNLIARLDAQLAGVLAAREHAARRGASRESARTPRTASG